MLGFLRIYCLVGLPLFLAASFSLWKPNRQRKASDGSIAARVAWTVAAVGLSIFLCFPLVFLPFVILAIWKPEARPDSTADRLAWTVFALGVCLMVTMTLYTMALEGDGSWRSWETIRRHRWIFLALAMITVSGPLAAYLTQALRTQSRGARSKPKPLDDEW